MPNYQNILKNSARVTISTSDGPLNVDYYPGKITQNMVMQLEDFLNQGPNTTSKEQFHEMNTLIIGLIKTWDLMDGDSMFPLDADSMMILPVELVGDIIRTMTNPK